MSEMTFGVILRYEIRRLYPYLQLGDLRQRLSYAA